MASLTWNYATGSSTSATDMGIIVNGSDVTTTSNGSSWLTYPSCDIVERIKILPGKRTLELPDGAKLVLDDDGNYKIDDANAQVIYKANRIREFSPHLNASDMLAEFVAYVGDLGIRRADVLNLPLHLFVAWLIIEAAERDGDDVPSDVVSPAETPELKACRKPRCKCCGRFVKRLHYRNRFPYCSLQHAGRHLQRIDMETMAT